MEEVEAIKTPKSALDVDVVTGELVELHPDGNHAVITLGSNIGSGLFIATGKGIANAGPLGAVIAYGLVASCVAAVLQVLGEMTIAFPTSGNFIDYADRFLGWCAVLGSEATFFSLIISTWNSAFPEVAGVTIFIVGAIVLFSLPNRWFAWFEYFTSILKVIAITLFLILDFAIIFGAGPKGKVYHGETWNAGPVFKNGFNGFSTSSLLALWAMSDQVFITIMVGEAESPRYAMSRAAKTVPVRVALLYLMTITFSSLLISPNDPRLFGGSAITQSPFTIALKDAGIHGLDQFLNVVILISCFGFGAESVYVASRILRALSHQRLIPELIASVDSRGRPIWSLIITGSISIALTYLNFSRTGTTIFNWLVSITSSAFFTVWIIISITSFRFRAALKKQKDPLFKEVFAFRTCAWPLPTIWLLTCSVFLLVCCIYSGLYPLGSDKVSAYNFFQYMIGVVIVLVFSLAHKVIYRTKLRAASEVDLRSGRRTLQEPEIAMLKRYYDQPAWRRALTYVKFW
ncbi:uncharacterized protein LY89DRAFT_774915 [Mollisia scopiformis]|uniref:Amino acid permease/ SLC12A domain-containing protein n=1 Tax=Mollisia scopiformis TaxID=149040 RepID=A0A194XG72_MOLSC|nr:uncharacterized protein LY89DRAFT_774915 [Mollisia scopiformis]KUJ18772.1 hypothetical protein LY89DRAFT_774915 [Mollisia scopiformis]